MEGIDYHEGERSKAEFDVEEMKIVWAGSREVFEVSDRMGRLVASDEVNFFVFSFGFLGVFGCSQIVGELGFFSSGFRRSFIFPCVFVCRKVMRKDILDCFGSRRIRSQPLTKSFDFVELGFNFCEIKSKKSV